MNIFQNNLVGILLVTVHYLILIFPADNIWGVTLGLALIFTLLVLYFFYFQLKKMN